ncbi:MAG: sigma-70 family RNA polymerase sigma factor [Bacteroidota bacterium]|nr:sigma-70 family RNA polymerase sigma factor [Bacteroidota bacterium]MDP4213290.1 sigma-70 family RNA polymerase sigma factor [Bacteroidota bacterium]MDP4250388.1 sigma-70 family RNA polymerase sigma factor [Bacteroidota bacterium]
MQNEFTQNMVGAFNEGDARYIVRWFNASYPKILNKVKIFVGESSETLDLVMEVVTKFLERKGTYDTVMNMNNYVDRVIETVCLRYKKRVKTRRDNSYDLAEYMRNLEDEAAEKANTRAKYEYLQYLATENLPKQCLHVFHFYYHEELRHKEIARRLNISEKAVEHHKNTAFKKLRIKFENETGGNPSLFLFVIALPVFVIYLLIQKMLS